MDKVVVYAGTRNLYEQMYVCVKSLLANTMVYRVYLLIEDDEFPYQLPDNVCVANVSKQEFFLPGSPNYSSPWSYMAMLRCVLSFILKDESRVLWLDCDTIVNEDIGDLFDIDMEGYYYAGVVEPQKSKDIFRYINSGVLLCNLDLLRESQKEVELAWFLNHYKFHWADQEVINLLCQGHIRTIDSEYNQNAFTVPCVRPRIIHYAADKSFKDSWAYKKYESMDLFAEPEDKSDE